MLNSILLPRIGVLVSQRRLQTWMFQGKDKKGNMKHQKFEYLLALDFEATCLKDETIIPQEIIEFPCLKINTKTFQIESEFHRYVRPIHNPHLSDFCIELTGINQGMVDNESNFNEVFKVQMIFIF